MNDRETPEDRSNDARILEGAAAILEEKDAGGFDTARRTEVVRYLISAARRLRSETDADGNIPTSKPPGWRPPDKLAAPRA